MRVGGGVRVRVLEGRAVEAEELLDGLTAVPRALDTVAHLGEHRLDHLHVELVVLRDEDAQRAVRVHLPGASVR